jgi:hypothetical protein
MRYASLLGLAVCILVPASAGFAQGSKDVKAVVQSVDANVGTITVLLESGAGLAKSERIKTFNLARADLPITDGAGKPLKLTDLETDRRVFLKFDGDDVQAIRVAPPTFFGQLSRLDKASRTVVVTSKIGTRTIQLPMTAKIIDHGQPANFDDLKTGVNAIVYYSEDQKAVLELHSGKGLMPLVKLVKAVGYMIDVDRDKHTAQIFINFQGGDSSVLRETRLAKDATFSLMYQYRPYRDITLKEVGRGLKANFWMDTSTRRLVHVEIEMPTLGRRMVKSVDAAKREIVLEDSEGEKKLQVAASARITFTDGRRGRLEDVEPGMFVNCGLGADRKHVEVVVASKK